MHAGRRKRVGILVPVAVACLLPFAGCGGDDAGPPSDPGATKVPAESPSASALDEGRVVRFRSVDGVRLAGRLFGDGDAGIVFSHMGRAGDTQSDWYEVAAQAAERGYLALTYNLRGVCPGGFDGCSRGTDDLRATWKDVLGARRFLRSQGAREVALVGASIGAMSSIFASGRVESDAVVSIGGLPSGTGYDFIPAFMQSIDAPKLFVSARDDSYGGAAGARAFYRMSRAPKRLLLVGGAEHGTDIFLAGGRAERSTRRALFGFLARWVPADP